MLAKVVQAARGQQAKVVQAARGQQEVHFAVEPQSRGDKMLDRLARVRSAVKHRKVRRFGKKKPGVLGDAEEAEARDANWWSGQGQDTVVIEETFERSDSEETVAEESDTSSEAAVAAHEPMGFETPRLSVSSRATSSHMPTHAVAQKLVEDDPWADSDPDPWADSDDEVAKPAAHPDDGKAQDLGGAQPAPVVVATPPKPQPKAGNPRPSGQASAQQKQVTPRKKAAAKAAAAGDQKPRDQKKKQQAALLEDPWADSDDDRPSRGPTPPPVKASHLAPKPPGKPPSSRSGSAASAARKPDKAQKAKDGKEAKEAKDGGRAKGAKDQLEKKVRLPKEDPKVQAAKDDPKANKKTARDAKKPAVINEKVEHFAAF